jgi:hypothetical protein
VDWTRREFLAKGGVALVGVGAMGSLGFRWPSVATEPVPGPFGHIYGPPGQPRALTLTYVEDLSSTRTITWLTTGDADPGSNVEFGVVPEGATPQEIAEGLFLDSADVGVSELAPFGFGDSGENFGQGMEGENPVRVHRATMRDLPAGAVISYRVGAGQRWSKPRTFRPAPPATSGFRFTHIGDHGITVAARRTTQACLDRAPDFHLIAGDLSYANGDQRMWDVWGAELESLSGTIPLMLSPGNHEAKDWQGDTYRKRFTFPDHGKPWFSYDYNNVHIVSTTAGAFLDTGDEETARALLFDEFTWLEGDLAVAAARRAAGEIDFILVTQHFPLYTDHRTRGPFSPGHVALEENLLQRFQVDAVLVGHDHMYQRSKPMAFGIPTGDAGGGAGYVQVCAGAGGKSLYEFTPIDTTELAQDPENPYMRWSLWSDAWAREFSFVEYLVEGPEISGTAYGWLDFEGQNDVPQDPETYDQELVPVNSDGVDPDREPREIDRFTIRRKPEALLQAVPQRPRVMDPLINRLPEANGVIVRNLAEDCTLHHH